MKYTLECSKEQAKAFAPFFAKRGLTLMTSGGKPVVPEVLDVEVEEEAPKPKKRKKLFSAK